MANRDIRVGIYADDHASSVFANVRNNASSMASSLTTSLGRSVVAFGNLNDGIKKYNNFMHGFNRVVSDVARTAGNSIYNFTKDAINNFSELERQHAKTMGAMATEYAKTAEAQAKFLSDSEKLKQQAIRIGTVGVNGKGSLNSVTDISYAQTALVKSGMSADDLLNSNVVESILKFAGGNDLDVDTATTFAVNLGTVFNKPVEEWGKMLDQVTKAADISVIDVEDIMDSLTYTGGIASGLGRELTEVLGVISVMGQAGLRGRVAGTGLQAFFTRILSAGELTDTQIGNAPTEYVGQMYNAFTAEAVNADGTFKDMDEVASLLDMAMDSLNDQEQAWFAKKLFGLYQMKAAYALTGAVDGDANLITDFINQIENGSGSNDMKYELMQASQYGKITSLHNVWEGIKTDFGDRLSPVVSAVADELLAFLSNNGNYNIDVDRLRDALNESGDLISEKYGQEIGEAVANIGNLGVDAGMIAGAMMPYAGGLINGLSLLMQGDISGALDAFNTGLNDTNDEIEELPPELQGSARAARNVITAFTTLAGINLGTKILQIFTSVAAQIGKIFKGGANTTIASTSATIQIGTANVVNIGEVPLMNVTASVVNIYGGNGTNPNTPTNPLPQLPSPTLPPVIVTQPYNPTMPGGIPTLPGNGGSIPQLTDGTGSGDIVMEYKYNTKTGKFEPVTKVGTVAKLATKFAGLAALTYIASQIPIEDQNTVAYQYGFGTDYENYLGENYKSIDSVAGFFNDVFGTPAGSWRNDMTNWKMKQFKKNEIDPATPDDYRNARDEYFNSIEGFKDYDAGKNYLSGMMDRWYWENYNGNQNFISKEQYLAIAEGLLSAMNTYMEDNNINSINDIEKNGLGGTLADAIPGINTDIYNNVFNAFDDFINRKSGITDNSNTSDTNIGDAILEMSKKIKSPTINVNVIKNVDKNGNATSTVDINNISRSIARRSSQYGQTAVIN